MNILNALLLLSVPSLPLLLAFPNWPLTLKWRTYIALLPAVILLFSPAVFSIELPWLLLGTGLGLSEDAKWLLGATVLLWLFAVHFVSSREIDNRLTIFFLFIMAGNLGAILTTELIGFFVFSTLMGYAFFGLLVSAKNKTARRTGRIYLICLILADLALFEALLLAATTTDDLSFDSLHQAMALSEYLNVYLLMVLFGFALKAGIWPLHFWLSAVLTTSSFIASRLLIIAMIPMALLGALRWLPLGMINWSGGLAIQLIGNSAMLYALICIIAMLYKKKTVAMLTTYATLFVTGIFTLLLGSLLADSIAGNHYRHGVYYFLASLSLALTALLMFRSNEQDSDTVSHWFERWPAAIVKRLEQIAVKTLPKIQALCFEKINRLWQHQYIWQKMLSGGEGMLQRWHVAITLFLLVGIAVVYFVTYSSG